MDSILVIEDDCSVQRALKHLFQSEGYAVECSCDGSSGLEALRAAPPSIVILDLNLPGMTGTEICRKIRQAFPDLPVIVLSAAAELVNKILLLELGADDYVTKPFSPRELLARVRAAIRLSRQVTSVEVFSFGNVTVDFRHMLVTRGGRPVACSPLELKILRFFADNPERVVSRDELLSQVWGYEVCETTRTVDNYIMRLRQKVEGNPTNPLHFRTVHGAGYKFVK
jgi:two-component system alkaline phosphatase synthesis response regulator PhoP